MGYYELSWIGFIIASAAHVIIIYTYYSSIFEMKYSKRITIGICIVLASINLVHIYANNAIVNITASIIILLTVIFFFKGGLLNRAILSLFLLIAGVISEFFVGYVLVTLSGNEPNEVLFGTPEYIYGLMLSRILLAIFARVISGIAKKHRLPKLKGIHWVSLIVPPTGSLFILYSFMYLRTHNVFDMISSIIIMVSSIIVINIYGKILFDYEVEIKNKYLEELLKYYHYQYYLAEQSEKLILKTKHDIKNLLIGFQTGIQSQDSAGVQNSIKRLLGEIDAFNGPANSGNIVIDSIINYKANIARKSQIFFSMDLHIPEMLSLDSIAICQIMGSALDNAIEATEKIENVTDRVIQISASYKQDALFIHISNPYLGDIITNNDGYLMSSKRKKCAEGIGLQSIMSIVAEKDGLVDVDFKNNQFCLSVTLYNVSMSAELTKHY